MNWGGFGSGFSQGFNNGASIGKTIGDAMKQKKMDDVRAQGVAEAQASRASDVAGKVQEVGLGQPATSAGAAPAGPTMSKAPDAQVQTTPIESPTSQTIAPPAPAQPIPQPAAEQAPPAEAKPTAPVKPFQVGKKSFDTREEAMKHADTLVPPMTDYLTKKILPKQQQALIEAGDYEGAEKLGTYMESKKGKDATVAFGKAMTKLLYSNDLDGGVQALGEYYNKHIDDGVDFVGGKPDGKGNLILTTRDKETGKESQRSMSKSELIQMGFANDPVAVFKHQAELVKAEQAQAAEIAKENRGVTREIDKEKRGETRDIAKEKRAAETDAAKSAREQEEALEMVSIKAGLDEAGATAKTRAEVTNKAKMMKDAGYSEESIRSMLPEMLGIGSHKKTTDPTERRALVVDGLMKNDPRFASEKDPKVQDAKVDRMMSIIYRDEKAPAAAGGLPKPASQATAKPTPAGKGKGVPVWDTKTNSMIYR